MHISDGVLAAPTLLAGAALAVTGVGIGLAVTPPREIPKVAMLAATLFVASLVHVPIGPVHMHLVLIGLAGLLLGWAALPALLIALTLQAVLFGYGGLTTLGVNVCVMGVPAVAVGVVLRRPAAGARRDVALAAGFAAGALSILLAATLLMLALWTTGDSLRALAKAVFVAHLPLAIVEGVLTAFVVGFVRRVRPELLTGGRPA